LLKYISLTIVRIILAIKRLKFSEKIHHIVRNLMVSFQKNGNKYCSKYCNASRCVLSQSFIRKISRKQHFLKKKPLISWNAILKPLESITIDEITSTQVAQHICGPSLVGYLIGSCQSWFFNWNSCFTV